MKLTRLIGPILGLAATLTLAACGGGSSPAVPPDDNPPGGGPVSVTAIGTITGFGSIFVGGERYQVRPDTSIAIEDEAETTGDDSRLRLGMRVKIVGTDDNGQRAAQRIEFDEDLRGPIENITPDLGDATIGTFEVMRQIVSVDARTAYDNDIGDNDGNPGIGFGDLMIGMVVEVSAYPTGGGFLATRVDRELDGAGGNPTVGQPDSDGDELEMKGTVAAFDGTSLTINGVVFVVDDRAVAEDGLAFDDSLIGRFVEVKADVVGGVLFVVRLQDEDAFDDNDRRGEIEIEGILEAVDPDRNTFTINGITYEATDVSSLVPLRGQRVEIKGRFDGDRFVLREAGQDIQDNVRTEDLVAAKDTGPDGPSFTTRLGLTIRPTGVSRVEDDTGSDGDHLTPGQFVSLLEIGDRIEARGVAGDPVTWTRVERRTTALNNNEFDCELRGPVSPVTGDTENFESGDFVIEGVTVLTDQVQDNNFENANDQPIGRQVFFDQLQPGDIVEAKSFDNAATCASLMLQAREVAFEP